MMTHSPFNRQRPPAFATSSSVNTLQLSLNSLSQQVSIWETQLAKNLNTQMRTSNSGVAQALALAGTTDLQPDENFAVSMNVGTFRGQTAFASAGVTRLSQHVLLSAGITTGFNGGSMGARAGIRFGW